MDTKKVDVERVTYIWRHDGDRLEVGEDVDGLELVEIRSRSNGKIEQSIVFSREEAPHVAKAILEHLADVDEAPSGTVTLTRDQYNQLLANCDVKTLMGIQWSGPPEIT